MATSTRRRGRGRRVFFGLLVILALLWCGYWFAATRIAAAGIERAMASLSAGGGSATCLDAGMSGFPLTLDLRCNGGQFITPDRLSASLAGVSASALLYWPGHVEAHVVGPLALEARDLGGPLEASWSRATASADIGLGGLGGATATLDDLVLAATGQAPSLPFRRMAMKNGFLALSPLADEAYRFAAAGTGIAVERTAGEPLPTFAGELAVVAEKFGGSLGTDPARAFGVWVARGGALKVERLGFVAGDTSASATGNLVVAPDGLLSGTLTVRIVGLDRLADLAETLRPGSREQAAQVIAVLSAFTKPQATGAREIVLVVKNGAVFAGMFPLPFLIPPLRF